MRKVDLWVPRMYTEGIVQLGDIFKRYKEVQEHYKEKTHKKKQKNP